MDIRMKMLRYLLAILSIGTAFAQVQPSTDNTPQTLGNKTLISPVIKGAQLSGAMVFTDQMPGADMGLRIGAAIAVAYAFSSSSAHIMGYESSGQTFSVNPFTYAGASISQSGTLELCGVGSVGISQPIVVAQGWRMEGCGSVAGQGYISVFLQAIYGTFQPTYTTGTITKGTPGWGDIITGSGTTFNARMAGCAFVAPATQPTGANNTYGIIHSVTDATHIVLGYGASNGSGAGAASTYAIYCPVVVQGDGYNAGGYVYTGELRHLAIDCNNIAGCVGLMNWYGEEGTSAHDLVISGFTNIGFDRETPYAEQSGPYDVISISPGNSCTAATIDYVSRIGNVAQKPLRDISLNNNCATTISVGADIQSSNEHIEDWHTESETVAISVGANTSCAVACPMPPASVYGFVAININNVGGGTIIHLSDAIDSSGIWGAVLHDISTVDGVANTLVDDYNSCTLNAGNYNTVLGTYETFSTGAVAYISNSSTATCNARPTFNPLYAGSYGISSSGNITATGSAISAAQINAANQLQITSVSSASGQGLYSSATNNLAFSTNSTLAGDIDATQHFRIGPSTSSTISSGACGASTNGTISGNDHAGLITIGSATTATCAVSFASAYTTVPRAVLLEPGNAGAASALSGEYISALSTSGFTITGTLASTNWYYWVQ
jgi:hypothetical protein